MTIRFMGARTPFVKIERYSFSRAKGLVCSGIYLPSSAPVSSIFEAKSTIFRSPCCKLMSSVYASCEFKTRSNRFFRAVIRVFKSQSFSSDLEFKKLSAGPVSEHLIISAV